MPILTPPSDRAMSDAPESTNLPSASVEDDLAAAIFAGPPNLEDVARQYTSEHAVEPHAFSHEVIKTSAQALVNAKKIGSKKAYRAYLDEEIARLSSEAAERARKREEGKAANAGVEEELRKLGEQYEVERRVMGRRIEALKK